MKKYINKNGFTLLELLAVIVILAIILLITTPIVLGVIEKARVGTFKSSIENIVRTAGITYTKEMINQNNSGRLEFYYEEREETSNKVGSVLEYRGEKPDSGVVMVNSKGEVNIALYNKKYKLCGIKEYSSEKVIIKEKIEEEECLENINKPQIELIGGNFQKIEIEFGGIYILGEDDYLAYTSEGERITNVEIYVDGIKTNVLYLGALNKEYEIIYRVIEGERFTEVKKIIEIVDTLPPIIEVPNNTVLEIFEVETYDLRTGITVEDNSGENINFEIEGGLSKVPGTYTITYTALDSSGNIATKVRIIDVIDTEAPVITILGDNPMTVEGGEIFTDPGATAYDDVDGDVTGKIVITNDVNTNIPGEYNVTYKVLDNSNNEGSATRKIIVTDHIIPNISEMNSSVSNIGATSFILNRVGDAIDVHSGLATEPYKYQVSINGTNWETKCTNNNISCNITGLTASTSYYYRICAIDKAGNENCILSKTVTTTTPMYYYDRYNVITKKTPYLVDSSSTSWSNYGNERPLASTTTYYSSYSFNDTTEKFVFSGSTTRNAGTNPLIGYYYSYGGGIAVFQNQSTTYVENGKTYNYIKWWYTNNQYSRGTLVNSNIVGTATEYPANGRHNDNYWYVRKDVMN